MDHEQIQQDNVVTQLASDQVIVTGNMINALGATKPWTLFISVLGFVSVALMAAIGLAMLAAAGFFKNLGTPLMVSIMGVIYIIMAVLYLIPTIYLYKYSSAVGRFLKAKQAPDMEAALSHQKSLWKFIGILCLIGIIVTVLVFVVLLIALVIGLK